MKVQALHSALGVLLLMACLVVGQLGRLGMRSDFGIQLFLPTAHEFLNFLFGLLRLGVELCDSRVLQFRTNIGKECDPVFPGTIVGIRIENDTDLVIAFLEQFVNPRSTQRTHQAFSGLGMQIKVDGNRPQKLVILKELFVFLFQGFNVQT